MSHLDPDTGTGEQRKQEVPYPFPLPMPPYGGFFAPMSELLPNDTGSLPNPPYQRCNLGVMLITDLVVDCVEIDWTVHLPLILHVVFLGKKTLEHYLLLCFTLVFQLVQKQACGGFYRD